MNIEFYVNIVSSDESTPPEFKINDDFVLAAVPRIGEYICIEGHYYVVRSVIYSAACDMDDKRIVDIYVEFVCDEDDDDTIARIERGASF